MNAAWIAAAEALVGVMEQENAALAAMDLGAAAALTDAKAAAAEALAVAIGGGGGGAAALAVRCGAGRGRAVAARLEVLTVENDALLKRALAAQGAVIRLLVDTARRARGGASRYTAQGTAAGTRASPMALSARA